MKISKEQKGERPNGTELDLSMTDGSMLVYPSKLVGLCIVRKDLERLIFAALASAKIK